MDALIEHAKRLAKQDSKYRYLPIKNRVAYVVSHAQSYASNGYAIRTQGIAEALSHAGFDPICFVRPGRPWELDSSSEINIQTEVNGIRHIHTPWVDAPKNEIERLEKTADIFTEQFKVFRPSSVIVATNYLIGLPAYVAARRLGLPLINEVRGFWELSRDAREPGYINTQGFNEERARNSFVANQSDKVFTLNSTMKAELVNHGVTEDKIDLMANAVSAIPKPEAHDLELAKSLGITSKDKVVGFVGSVTEYEGLDVLLQSCEQLVNQGTPIKLLLVGDRQPLTKLKASIEFKEKPWLIQTGRVPNSEIGKYYGLIDVVAIPRKPLRVCELVSPLKAVEAIAYSKKLVVSDLPALKEACVNGQVEFVTTSTATAFAAAIKKQLRNPEIEKRGVAIPTFSSIIAPLKKTLKDCTKGPFSVSVEQIKSAPKDKLSKVQLQANLSDSQLKKLGSVAVPVKGSKLRISATTVYQLTTQHKTKKAVVLFDFYDQNCQKLNKVGNIGISGLFKKHFRYLNHNADKGTDELKVVENIALPDNVARVEVNIAGLCLAKNDKVLINIAAECYNEAEEQNKIREKLKRQPLPPAIVHDPFKIRTTKDLNVACVLDEFTTECMSHEVNLIPVTQENWQKEIQDKDIDFLLVESCWRGNNGNWGTITKGSGGGKKLSPLIRYCKQNKIPTVFWNKEDPPHYEKFGAIAALFDVAITTDINMVPRYKADFGITAYPLSFGAQPIIHNPKPIITRHERAAFAGSYYSDKPKRCEDFNHVMAQVKAAGVDYDIYDRNFGMGVEKFAFPEHYQANIVGKLPPSEVWKAHKGYKYQINMNSVQDSATMFARRVYESLASGTPVISNDSVGVKELFGDVVIMPSQNKSIEEQLSQLESEPAKYEALARAGVRKVMRQHTYGHRVQEICRVLGIEVSVEQPSTTLAVTAKSAEDVERAKQLFNQQTAVNKKLFVKLDNFDTAYKFLNESNTTTVTYAMALAEEFYRSKQEYYGTELVLEHDLKMPLTPEAMEDFSYWGGLNDR